MRTRWIAAAGVIVLVVVALGASGCGGGKSKQVPSGAVQSEVAVRLSDYTIAPEVTSVPAGSVKFSARNIGGTAHELRVIKTDLAPDALPTKADGSVDEGAAELTVVDKVTNIAAGTQKALTVDLASGNYVLICNLVQKTADGQTVSHYQRGGRVQFQVTS